MMAKIDIFPHILTPKYIEAISKKGSGPFLKGTMGSFHALSDLDTRFRIMDKYEGLVQVLTLGAPPVEEVATPRDAPEIARIANDEMAELVIKYPERFVAAVACLPMNNIDAALRETDRAITELNFKGIQILTHTNGKPIDRPEFMPLYEKMCQYDLPIWLHPHRTRDTADYSTEDHSRYWVFQTFGWPYETTVAMTRLVLSGVLERYPNIKFITHHCNAMLPYFAQRIIESQDYAEAVWGAKYMQSLSKPLIDYFRMFYPDTAIYGNTPALMCGYALSGAEHLLFGTDMPYDKENGDRIIRQTISAIEAMDIPDHEKKHIFEGNAKRLLRLSI
ncbi:amidohydrolase family protein [Chloroflexota bacterium]